METWFILILSLGIAAVIYSLFFSRTRKKLPPGPLTVPIIGNLMWLTKSFGEIEPTLRGFMLKYGPIISLKIGSRTFIFISSHSLAHCTLGAEKHHQSHGSGFGNPKVWKDPVEFKPERFIIMNKDDVFDITGNKEIKMMPFGAGRRICPGLGLSMLHLEYFVGNLVWLYEWKVVDGEEVDLSEKLEFTTVMKNPLKAHISPRG